ncbi:hypothetical protein KOJCDNHJ_00020 [Xanthomonas citri pv. punicae]|nr:hypothetical protein FICKIIDM_02635 [Xanthomonas citri pv. punicae]UIS26637.1 hypothetical protein KOJCDNHJ_00020 [Xanthomonas citri pv. punicae]CCF67457.1 putative uncharacterized protein [Xanthomonas citri pv. punicae str. LMG 859]
MVVGEVRMEALDRASAKRHALGRPPRRECRNAKECKVCRGSASPTTGAVLIERWLSSLACLYQSQDISRG